MQTCPKCKAKIGIVKEIVTVDTGAVHSVKCLICGFWVQTPWQAPVQPLSPSDASGVPA